jgi:hypothetical protein
MSLATLLPNHHRANNTHQCSACGLMIDIYTSQLQTPWCDTHKGKRHTFIRMQPITHTPSSSSPSTTSDTLLNFLASRWGTLSYFSRSSSPIETTSSHNSGSSSSVNINNITLTEDDNDYHDDNDWCWSNDVYLAKKTQ